MRSLDMRLLLLSNTLGCFQEYQIWILRCILLLVWLLSLLHTYVGDPKLPLKIGPVHQQTSYPKIDQSPIYYKMKIIKIYDTRICISVIFFVDKRLDKRWFTNSTCLSMTEFFFGYRRILCQSLSYFLSLLSHLMCQNFR